MCASALTWPIEKSKLLYQGGGTTTNASGVVRRLIALPLPQHALGMLSSSFQRGGSAFFMFACQQQIYTTFIGTSSPPSPSSSLKSVLNHMLAGAVSGALTAPFHTYWELAKVRGHLLYFNNTSNNGWKLYQTCLVPMIFRHAIFDGVFFGVSTASDVLGQQDDNGSNNFMSHAGVKFGLSAATASLANLVWDVWKTRRMEAFPMRIGFVTGVLQTMTLKSFLLNYAVKGTDLTVNWFVVGCLKEHNFF